MEQGCTRRTAAIVGAPFAVLAALVAALACTTRIAPASPECTEAEALASR